MPSLRWEYDGLSLAHGSMEVKVVAGRPSAETAMVEDLPVTVSVSR